MTKYNNYLTKFVNTEIRKTKRINYRTKYLNSRGYSVVVTMLLFMFIGAWLYAVNKGIKLEIELNNNKDVGVIIK